MYSQDALKEEWRNLAAPWIRESREGRNANRAGLLDGYMLEACGQVAGRRILDCGCGEGRFCRMLAARGAASVTGIDLCESMISAARELQSETEAYHVANAENLGMFPDESFDIVVSYLNQCDLADFERNNREVFRVLRGNGRFVVANLHPMRSAVGDWHFEADGRKAHVIVDQYFGEGPRQWTMLGVEFTNFHRTLAMYRARFFGHKFAGWFRSFPDAFF